MAFSRPVTYSRIMKNIIKLESQWTQISPDKSNKPSLSFNYTNEDELISY